MADIANLRAFLEAASHGSFVAASEHLHLSHSSVSARIRALESELGVRLFHRGRHGVSLNKTGKSLLPFAENIAQTWLQAKSSIQAIASGNVPIRAGVQQDLWEIFGADWFALLKTRIPELQLHLTADTSTRLCERVDQQLLDLAITFEPKRQRGVLLEPIAELNLRLTSKKPMVWTEQLPNDYFHVDWGTRFEDWHSRQFGQNTPSTLQVEVAGIALLMLQRQGGTAFFPEELVAKSESAGELFFVSEAPQFSITVYLACPLNAQQTERMTLAQDTLRSVVQKLQS